MSKEKKLASKTGFMAREIGILKARVMTLEHTADHYRAIIGQRDKALHGMKRALKEAKRQIKAGALHVPESVDSTLRLWP